MHLTGSANQMASWLESFKQRRKPAKQILLVGLDASGKTTIANYMRMNVAGVALDPNLLHHDSGSSGHTLYTTPTIGVELVEFRWGPGRWKVWDISGQARYRELWSYYYGCVHGIVFVVDVTDVERMGIVKDELDALLRSISERGKPAAVDTVAHEHPRNRARHLTSSMQML